MTAFVDAHALLWVLFSPNRLSAKAAGILRDATNILYCSDASLAELLNKCGRGKLPIAGTSLQGLYEDIVTFGVQFQPILQADVLAAASLSHHHSDPFDRLLIAQAIRLHVPVLTIDGMFQRYDVQTIW